MGTKSGALTRLLERIPRKFPQLHVQSIDVTYIGEVSGHGSGLYVRIPKEVVDWFSIVAGDRLKVSILQRKNWRDEIDVKDEQNSRGRPRGPVFGEQFEEERDLKGRKPT